MNSLGWPELGVTLGMIAVMIGSLALQVGIVVAGVWIALTLWHRRDRVRE